MANGSSFAALSRRGKSGRVGTAGGDMPAPMGAIGAVEDSKLPPLAADTSDLGLSASDLDFLAGGSALTPPASAISATPLASLDPFGVKELSSSGLDFLGAQPAQSPAPAVAADAPTERSKISHIPGSAFSGLSALAASRSIPEAPRGREYVEPTGGLAALERKGPNSGVERSARKDVHAVKIVTRLVRAIAFRPGSDANPRVKTEVLSTMLGEVHRAASAVAIAAAPLDAHRGWVQAMCAEAMAELVAARSENDTFGEPLDIDQAVSAIKNVFETSDSTEMVAEAIANMMTDSGYVEATSEAIAVDKVRVSIGLASWDLFDNVVHPRLGVEAFRYTYAHKPEEIVALLVEETVRIAREMNIRTSSLDSRTMHLQGSIRRVAALIGSEYVNRTRQIMNWIGENDTEEEYQRRNVEAQESLKTVVIPQVVALARHNFIAIEQIAPQLLEESKHAHANTPRENAS